MTNFNGFKGRAKRLDDVDLPALGYRIGVGEDELHAFMDVETSGSGFDPQGRPKILFEPHVFYRNLSGAKRDAAVSAGLAYKSQGTKPYGKESEQYPKLVRAIAIDEAAGLKACSWGLSQVLAENHATVGYATPQAMVLAFMDDEEKHLEAMVEFLIKNEIDDDLRAHRWATVARVYNGPKYAINNYDTRMATAFAKWSKIRDTPWSPDQQAPTPLPPDIEPPLITDEPLILEPKPAAPTSIFAALAAAVAYFFKR